MIQLSAVMWTMAVFFAMIGFLRGWNREIVAMAGIILALFTLFQFDSLIRGTLLANVGRDQVFIVQVLIFIGIVFISYQTRAVTPEDAQRRREGRDSLQESVLGAIIGFINGYLIWGSLWYFMDINEYPLAPYITAPAPGSPSDQVREILPLVLLAGGPGGSGDMLAVAIIVLFIVVLFII